MFGINDVAGKRVLFAMAVDAEYGPHLQRLFTPLITGVGPVEAAVSVSATLASLAANQSLPDLVVSLGSAGSRTLEQAEIYQVDQCLLPRHGRICRLASRKAQRPSSTCR